MNPVVLKDKNMKLDFSMAKAGDKNVGPLEIQRPNGEYVVWDIVKRGRLYLIGSMTNSGLLSKYYYVSKPKESLALIEIEQDLEVRARGGDGYMGRIKRIPKKGLKKKEELREAMLACEAGTRTE